ncbi:hypothetical protein [Limnohabitans sp. Bal53]|uniref:hypothetical protein n=1 Tax=Limnohabitans sp. Bal53 TaxID=1977910 RepID=UPI000D399AB8|nr:hypothetical protein [Limnohabitans sp. Bal53]PUE42779.1 hypothetical protein B9Z50_02825 [Limnohabitans sp. Bal53]
MVNDDEGPIVNDDDDDGQPSIAISFPPSLRAKHVNPWIASYLAMTGEGTVSFLPVIASEARQSMDRFVPRDDGSKVNEDDSPRSMKMRGQSSMAMTMTAQGQWR